MNERILETMVTHLVQCTCNSVINCPKDGGKGPIPPKDLALKQVDTELCADEVKAKASMTWNAILKGLLPKCSQFCNCKDEVVNIPRPLINARWRETNDRKVLAPLALKQNTDNIIARNVDMNGKRKADVDIWAPSKRIKLESCSVVIRRTSLKNLLLQYKCVSRNAVVKLYDVFKEIPQVREEPKVVQQNDFMSFLGLETKESVNAKQLPEEGKTGHPVKLASHPNIPFSSDYGRRLLARERHCLPPDVALRKLERTEWYLKGAATKSRHDFRPAMVPNERKAKCTHTYTFPKRQCHQKHLSLNEAFLWYICKPVRVEVETTDVAPFLAKKKALQAEAAVLPNTTPREEDIISISDTSSVASSGVCTVNCVDQGESENNSEGVRENHVRLEAIVPVKDKCTNGKPVLRNSQNQKKLLRSSVNATNYIKKPRRSLRLNHVNTL